MPYLPHITKPILMIVLLLSLSRLSFGFADDEKNTHFKPRTSKKIEHKDPDKVKVGDKEDTLTYDKGHKEDTLTFDKNKKGDDTLIFADDEMRIPVKQAKKEQHLNKKSDSVTPDHFNPTIYPNPSTGNASIVFGVSGEMYYEIMVMTVSGTLVKNEKVYGNSYLIETLPVGNYIITIQSEKETIRKRFFVK